MQNRIEISSENLQDMIYLNNGIYNPLTGFMNQKDYFSVVEKMLLEDGTVWTLPISLDVDFEVYKKIELKSLLQIFHEGQEVGHVEVNDKFEVDTKTVITSIFKTNCQSHPGVIKKQEKSRYRVGGRVKVVNEVFLQDQLCGDSLKKEFAEKGWKTIVGFQTRNPIHRGHEYLQRLALNFCDGLFVNPSIGWKKKRRFY